MNTQFISLRDSFAVFTRNADLYQIWPDTGAAMIGFPILEKLKQLKSNASLAVQGNKLTISDDDTSFSYDLDNRVWIEQSIVC